MRGRAVLLKFVNFILGLVLLGTLALAGVAAWIYFELLPDLPSIESLQDVNFQVPLRVYSRDGGLIAEFGEKRRVPLAVEDAPDTLLNAFIAAEDDRFRDHPGVDYQGLVRAAITLLTTGRKEQGGSTITMQVARNFFLTPEKTYTRKLREILLALQIERSLDKDQILELYLNKIYLGNRAYGVAAAAQIYYGREPGELTLAESAMIAGLPKAPSRNNPLSDPARALQRRDYVLGRMRELGFVTADEYAAAVASPLSARRYAVDSVTDAQYVAEMVRAQIVSMFGEEAGYTGGYRVYTTIDARLQNAANLAVRNGLFAYEERHGYRGPADNLLVAPGEGEAGAAEPLAEDTIDRLRPRLGAYPTYEPAIPALVTVAAGESAQVVDAGGRTFELALAALKWARPRLDPEGTLGAEPESVEQVLKPGDVVYLVVDAEDKARLVQLPRVEGALASLDPRSGALRALVGGFSFSRSKFNRAVQAFRQPGSNFKPFIYSAALENGFTPATLVNDAPVVFNDPALEGVWRPENYSGRFYGPTRLREALVKSRNLVSVRVLISVGVAPALRYAERFGFRREQLPRDLSLVLGSGSVSPLELARAYAVFANGGYLVSPYFIERIEDGQGNVLYNARHVTVCPECAPLDAEPLPARGDSAGTTFSPLSETAALASDEAATRPAPRVINERNAFIMRSMLGDVVRSGTARRARSLNRSDIAGKTGTTNDQRDTWFSGFNGTLVTTAWLGYDSQLPLGNKETGGRAALPIWIDYMRVALDGVVEDEIRQPDGLVTALIDRRTGEVTTADNPQRLFEIFRVEHAPQLAGVAGTAPVSGAAAAADTQTTSPEQLF